MLPQYGHHDWHIYGSKLACKLRSLTASIPVDLQTKEEMQAVADKLHAAITSTARQCLPTRKKGGGNKKMGLPKHILRTKKALRAAIRKQKRIPRRAAGFETRAKALRSTLTQQLQQLRKTQALRFAKQNAPQLQKLASRQAWRQVKKVMARGQRRHSALRQEEFLHNGERTTDTQTVVHQHLTQLLHRPAMCPVSEDTMEELRQLSPAPTLPPSLGSGAFSDKSKPPGETEYPRVPWQTSAWGEDGDENTEEPNGEGNGKFTAKFIRDAVRQLATQSSGGDDGITAELLRWIDSHHVAQIRKQIPEDSPEHDFGEEQDQWHWPDVMKGIAECFNVFLEHSFIPKQWKQSVTTLVYKKGNHQEVSNYRPIAAGNTLGKLFAHCVLYSLEGWATKQGVLSTLQRGFRSHRGCEDCILALYVDTDQLVLDANATTPPTCASWTSPRPMTAWTTAGCWPSWKPLGSQAPCWPSSEKSSPETPQSGSQPVEKPPRSPSPRACPKVTYCPRCCSLYTPMTCSYAWNTSRGQGGAGHQALTSSQHWHTPMTSFYWTQHLTDCNRS